MPIKGAANNQSLHVSTIPPKDLSTARYRCVKVPVQTSSITPIHVYMDRQSDLINLTRNFVELKVGFKTMGNANLTSHADAVATMHIPANNIAYTLFKQINCRANGTLLTEQVDMHHLKAYFQTLLNFDRDDRETILQCQGWRNEINSPTTYTANNVRTDHANFGALSAYQQASIK